MSGQRHHGHGFDHFGFVAVDELLASGSELGVIEPVFEIELLDAVDEQLAEAGIEVDRCDVLPNGDVLIEFAAEPGALYTVQYSEDGESWINVVPDVLAGGTKVQWIDNGSPKTASHPSGEKRRFYRLFKKETAE